MASIKGYFFSTLGEANQAVRTINIGEGIPKSADSQTLSYCGAEDCEGGYYILYDDVTGKYLGEPADITLPSITPLT